MRMLHQQQAAPAARLLLSNRSMTSPRQLPAAAVAKQLQQVPTAVSKELQL
jgi:hypothetical protein